MTSRKFLGLFLVAGLWFSQFGGAAVQAGQIRRIYNLTLTNSATEYSQALTGSVCKLTVKCRTTTPVIQLAFTANQSGTTYISINPADSYWEDSIVGSDITLYCQSPTAGAVVEIVAWSSN